MLDVITTEDPNDDIAIYSDKQLEEVFPKDDTQNIKWKVVLKDQPVSSFMIDISSTVNQEQEMTEVPFWNEEDDSFTETNLLDGEDKQIQEIIFQLRNSNFISINEILADRLITLFNEAKQEDPNISGINVGSLYNFYDFLLSNNNIKRPSLSLTPDNTIYASWKNEDNQLFSVHFLPNFDTKFVIFKNNYYHPERKIRLSGIATNDMLMKTVASHGVDEWILE